MEDNEEEIRVLRNIYAREWRKKNPDKVKEINARFYRKLRIKNKTKTERTIQNETN